MWEGCGLGWVGVGLMVFMSSLDAHTYTCINYRSPQLKRIIDAREFHSRAASSADPERKVRTKGRGVGDDEHCTL